MPIQDIDTLRTDMLTKAAEMRDEAVRLHSSQPLDAQHLQRIADRLEVYAREFLTE